MSVPGMAVTHGSPPYHESAFRAALRAALASGSLGAGLGAVPRGANFGTAFAAAAGGASKAYQSAQQAAQEYALKQANAQAEQDFRDYQKQDIMSQIEARAKDKVPQKQQDYEHLVNDLGMEPVKARQIIYGLTPEETAAQKKAAGEGKDTTFETFVKEAKFKKERPDLFPTDSTDTAWLDNIKNWTSTGLEYLDGSELQGKEKALANRHAAELGIPLVGKDTKEALDGIETARANMNDIMDQIGGLLPKDAAGRAVATPGIKLSHIFQTNDQRAAYNSWRTAAIQNLRATAGSRGLRINQAEIIQAVANDLPKLNDTVGAALQRKKNIEIQLSNVERPLLKRNLFGSRTAPSRPSAVPPPSSGDIEYVRDPSGKLVPK